MNRRSIFALAILLLIGVCTTPVQAQTGGPGSQETASQMSVHIVQRGDTLFSIARKYGLTANALAHTNGIPDPRRIFVGQRLVIPDGRANVGVTETVPYIVQAGDTLASIARRYHTTWQTLTQVNGLLSPNVVYSGQVIQLPSSGNPVDDGVATEAPANGGVAYIVRPDDTLFRIALHYGVSPWTLAAISQVANPALLYPGQELGIPGEGPGTLPEPFAAVRVQPLPVSQGTTLVITVDTTESVTLEGELLEHPVRFGQQGNTYYGLVGVHVFTEPGLYELELKAVDGQGRDTAVTTGVIVESGRFGHERIDVPASRTDLLDPAAIAADRERLETLRTTFTPERHWTTPLQRPCAGTISSYFGTHRSYSGGPYTSYHSGVDFRAPTGTPVQAPAGGTVILAGPLTLWGNAVLIDHGWGLVTGYGHLSAVEVETGQEVQTGETIGRVGSTGLSTGAHLHWEVWVGGNSVNGLQWLEESYPWSESEWLAIGG